jgi:hypothetical protein
MLTYVEERLAARRNRRRAGSRAREKYTEMRRAWLRRNRKLWALAAMVGVLVWLVFWWLMSLFPGDHSWSTAAFAGGLIATFVAVRQSPPVGIASWEEGAFGEEETAKQLRLLEKEGWVVLHDLANGSANFDHVVIGPNGVFCLNSKWSAYRLETGPEGRLVARHKYDEDLYQDIHGKVRRAKAEAAALSERIAQRCGTKIWVQPVIVWWGGWGDTEHGGRRIDGVGVVEGKRLAERLRAQAGKPVHRLDDVVQCLRPGRHSRGRRP